jgi:sulfonate transport system permease protein
MGRKGKAGLQEKTMIERWQPIIQWILPAVIVLLWILATMSEDFKLKLLPSPVSVIKRMVSMVQSGELWEYTVVSARRAFAGLLIGGITGYLLGMLNGMSKAVNAVMNTTFQMLRTIPILAMLPVFIIYLGIGEALKITVVAYGVFFPMYLNTYGGVRTIDSRLIEMSKVYGFTKMKLFKDIILPGSMQNVLVGVRISLGSMWLILVAAEMIGTEAGLGYMATRARELMQMDKVFLVVFIYAILGKLSDLAAVLLEKRFLRWNRR